MPKRDPPSSRSTRAAARRLARWTQQAEDLPLRRDMVALLTYLRDNRVTGTQSTGNLTLKAVREVTARFVHPPELDTTIGDRTYRLRTEYDVWPLYFLHTLAEVGGLLAGGPSRRWRLTSEGARFLSASPAVQVWVLLIFWWKYVNWLIAYPFGRMDEDLPLRFEEITLAHLLSLPVDTRIDFEPFADELIQETGLAWTGPDVTDARRVLRTAISRMVVDILADFGALEREYQDEPWAESCAGIWSLSGSSPLAGICCRRSPRIARNDERAAPHHRYPSPADPLAILRALAGSDDHLAARIAGMAMARPRGGDPEEVAAALPLRT